MKWEASSRTGQYAMTELPQVRGMFLTAVLIIGVISLILIALDQIDKRH
jgi:hypothetical protein